MEGLDITRVGRRDEVGFGGQRHHVGEAAQGLEEVGEGQVRRLRPPLHVDVIADAHARAAEREDGVGAREEVAVEDARRLEEREPPLDRHVAAADGRRGDDLGEETRGGGEEEGGAWMGGGAGRAQEEPVTLCSVPPGPTWKAICLQKIWWMGSSVTLFAAKISTASFSYSRAVRYASARATSMPPHAGHADDTARWSATSLSIASQIDGHSTATTNLRVAMRTIASRNSNRTRTSEPCSCSRASACCCTELLRTRMNGMLAVELRADSAPPPPLFACSKIVPHSVCVKKRPPTPSSSLQSLTSRSQPSRPSTSGSEPPRAA